MSRSNGDVVIRNVSLIITWYWMEMESPRGRLSFESESALRFLYNWRSGLNHYTQQQPSCFAGFLLSTAQVDQVVVVVVLAEETNDRSH